MRNPAVPLCAPNIEQQEDKPKERERSAKSVRSFFIGLFSWRLDQKRQQQDVAASVEAARSASATVRINISLG